MRSFTLLAYFLIYSAAELVTVNKAVALSRVQNEMN